MRFSRVFDSVIFPFTIFLTTIFLSSTASAEIKIKVVDPQEAVVAGAEVQLLEVAGPLPWRCKAHPPKGW